MVNHIFRDTSFSAVAVLFIIIQVAYATEPISYEDFQQSFEDAVSIAMETTDLKVSKLPPEVEYFIVDLYEYEILDAFETATKDQVTKILTKEITSRKTYYEQNKAIFKTFVLKVLEADLKNYPAPESDVNVMEIGFLSLMTMDDVTAIMRDVIDSKNAPVDDSWKILNLKDAFRTVYFYCKYPKEMAPFLTEKMRVEVKEWLDSVATWGNWGFDNGDATISIDPSINNDSSFKLEL